MHACTDVEEHLADSPYPLLVLPDKPSPNHSTVTGNGRRTATAEQAASFSIEARDQFGNRSASAARLLSVLCIASCAWDMVCDLDSKEKTARCLFSFWLITDACKQLQDMQQPMNVCMHTDLQEALHKGAHSYRRWFYIMTANL